MCHVTPNIEKPDHATLTIELGKRRLDTAFCENGFSDISDPLPKRTTPQFEDKFEINAPNLIHLIRDQSTPFLKIQEHLENNLFEIDTVEELFNCTALHYAVFHNRADVVKLLCEKGANLNIQNKHGFTPVLWAAEKNFTTLVKLLVKKGANLTISDNQGFSILHKSILSSNLELVQFLLNSRKTGECEFDINVSSDEGFTAIHQASLHGANKILKLLLANGATVDSLSRQKATPLHLAATKNNSKSAEILLLHGATVDLQDRSQRTPLHYACLFGHVKIIKLLLSFKASYEIKDRKQETPLSLALKSDDTEVISCFNLFD